MTVFESLVEALHDGFELFARTPDGYIVRTRRRSGWVLARVRMDPFQLW